jgi:hypothetical protein
VLAKIGVVLPEDTAEDDGVTLENVIRVPEVTEAKCWKERMTMIKVTSTMIEGR